MSGNGAYEREMDQDVAQFMSALRVAVQIKPDPMIGSELVPRLAQEARAASVAGQAQAGTSRAAGSRFWRTRPRLAMVARVGIAVALLPLLIAGMAFAGVNLPNPAKSAFERVGITLPNQATDETPSTPARGEPSNGAQGTGTGQSKGKGNGKGKGAQNGTRAHGHGHGNHGQSSTGAAHSQSGSHGSQGASHSNSSSHGSSGHSSARAHPVHPPKPPPPPPPDPKGRP
jgi:hypothetical protein